MFDNDDRPLLPTGGKFSNKESNTLKQEKNHKIYSNYDTLFSDARPIKKLEKKAEIKSMTSICPTNQLIENMKLQMEVQGSHRTLFYRQPSRKHISSYSAVIVDLENVKGSSRKVTFKGESDLPFLENFSKKEKSSVVITLPVKSEKMTTKGTQTDYRESEAQTLPWKHEIRAERKILAELIALECLDLERNFPPGKEQVTLIEMTRQKLAWEDVIAKMTGKENEMKRMALVAGLAAAETAFREKKLEEVHKERIKLSEKQMNETKEKFKEMMIKKLQRAYFFRRKQNDLLIDYWNHQLTRKLRKIKSNRNKFCTKYKKEDIISIHFNKTSDLYAPKIRDGENPSRGHENIDIKCRYLKRFHGLSILEKYITRILEPQVLGFNYEEACKPKKAQLCEKKYRERAIEEPEKYLDLPSLKIPVPAPTPEPLPTPKAERLRTDSEEDIYQASLLLTKIIKGRAIQTKKFLELYKMEPE